MSTAFDSEINKVLGKFDEAQPPGNGSYFEVGSYLCRVDSSAFRNGYKGISFVLELEVVKALTPDSKNPEGSMASFVKNLTTGKDAALTHCKGAVKAIAESVFGQTVPAEKITTVVIKQMASAEQPFRDAYVYVNAYPVTTQKGNEITGVSFRPCFQRDLDQYGLQQIAAPA
jgi:hypothetical protein